MTLRMGMKKKKRTTSA